MANSPYIGEHRLKHMLKVAAVSGELPVRNVVTKALIDAGPVRLGKIAASVF